MLSLQLKSGDYFTIGEDITVQVFQTHNAALKVMIKAPRELAILRGEVLERTEARPDEIKDRLPRKRSAAEQQRSTERLHKLTLEKAKRAQATAQRRALMDEMRTLLNRAGALTEPTSDIGQTLYTLSTRLDALDKVQDQI